MKLLEFLHKNTALDEQDIPRTLSFKSTLLNHYVLPLLSGTENNLAKQRGLGIWKEGVCKRVFYSDHRHTDNNRRTLSFLAIEQ